MAYSGAKNILKGIGIVSIGPRNKKPSNIYSLYNLVLYFITKVIQLFCYVHFDKFYKTMLIFYICVVFNTFLLEI